MAFDVKARYGDPIDTVKNTEKVVVQHVAVSNRSGDSTDRIEARIFIESPTYNGPAKGQVIAFDDVESLEDFAYALLTAADDAREALEANVAKASKAAVEDTTPTKPVVRKRSAASKAPRKKTA